MKYDLCRKLFDLSSKGLIFTATWLLVFICGLSAGGNTAQAQTRAYVANSCSNTVTVIDTATNTVITNISVSGGPLAVAFTPDSARAYVTHFSNTVDVIDVATNSVVATVPTGGDCPVGIAITPAPRVPRNKDECKNGGYRSFGPPAGPFRTQGQCVSYVESHSHH